MVYLPHKMLRKGRRVTREGSPTGLRPETEGRRGHRRGVDTIVVLGDSIAYGWGLTAGQSYPALLEEAMNRAHSGPPRWRVINAGAPGDTVLMGCTRYARDVTPFGPQIVLLHFGLNDAALRRTRFDVQREQLWRARHYLWARVGAVLRRFAKELRQDGPDSESSGQAGVRHEERPRVQPRWFVAGLGDLIRRVRLDGADPRLLSLVPVSPKHMSCAQWETYRAYDRLIREVAHRHSVPLVNLADGGHDPFLPDAMLAPDGIHLTAHGQLWLAQKVYIHLSERKP